LTRPGVADPNVFHLLDELTVTWRTAVREPSVERARFLFAVAVYRLLDALGYAAAIDRPDLSEDTNKLLRTLPSMSFSLAMSLSAPSKVLNEVSACVEKVLERTPLAERVHGTTTISSYF
jgi:hypothetical protein